MPSYDPLTDDKMLSGAVQGRINDDISALFLDGRRYKSAVLRLSMSKNEFRCMVRLDWHMRKSGV